MLNESLTFLLAALMLLWLPSCRRVSNPAEREGVIPGTSTNASERPVSSEAWKAIGALESETKQLLLEGRDAEAAEKMERVLGHFRESGQKRLAAGKDIEIGFHHGNRGLGGKAAGFFLEAFVLGSKLEGSEGEVIRGRTFSAMQDTALNLVRLGKAEEAMLLYGPLIAFLSSSGDLKGLSQANHNLAWILADSGKPAEAAVKYREALAARRMLMLKPETAWTLNNLGYVLTLGGLYEEAGGCLFEALSIARSCALGDVMAKARENIELLSIAAAGGGRHGFSAEFDLRLLDESGGLSPAETSRILLRAGENLELAGKTGLAGEAYDRLASHERAMRNPRGVARAARRKARCLKAAGEEDKAASALEECHRLAREAGDRIEEAFALLDSAPHQNSEPASARIDAAASIFMDLEGYRPGLIAVLEKRISIARASGRAESAAAMAKELEDLKAQPPPPDLDPVEFLEGMEDRGARIAGMKPSDAVIEIGRTGDRWSFFDVPTGRRIEVPVRYRKRKVIFQGMEFRLFGMEIMYMDMDFFAAAGERIVLARDGSLFRKS